MFGLIRHKNLSKEEYSDFRLNYCGTCKTIGRLFGHKERIILNNDVVFLSELLSAIVNRKEDFNYIKPATCWTLPQKEEQIPQYLRYAASINVLLGHYKIIDNVNDSKYKFNIWRLIHYLGNSSFIKAKNILAKQNFPIDIIENEIQKQFKCEKNRICFDNFHDTIQYYSIQTANITGLAFEHSVSNFNDNQLTKLFSEIGKIFGEIVYLVDVIEDYEKDKTSGKFNIILLHQSSEKTKLIEIVTNHIYECLDKIKSCIDALPINESKKKLFINSLVSNVTSKISQEKCCLSVKHCVQKSYSLKERFQYAIIASKKISFAKNNLAFKYSLFAFSAIILIILFAIFPNLVYSANHSTYQAGCCPDHCCSNCCESCCIDGCCNKCCECKVNAADPVRKCCREATDCQSMPCCGCCGLLAILGCCFGGAAEEGPTVIVKIIEVPAKGCCGE